jgi:hypothetical protein
VAPKPNTHHLASYIGRCHRFCVGQGCHGRRRNRSYCTGNRGAPPTKRKCYTLGATKSGGGRCKGGAPSPLLQPQPPLYRSPSRKQGMGRGGFNAPPPPLVNPVPVLPANQLQASAKGGGGSLSDHVLCPPRHRAPWYVPTSAELSHPPALPSIPESPDPTGWTRAPAFPPSRAQLNHGALQSCSPSPWRPEPSFAPHLEPRVCGWERQPQECQCSTVVQLPPWPGSFAEAGRGLLRHLQLLTGA